jgi:O-methyltransferase domain
MHSQDNDLMQAQQTFMDMLYGYQKTQLLHLAARLNLADHLVDRPRNVVELAKVCDVPLLLMERLLRGWESIKLIKNSDTYYRLTVLGEFLISTSENSLKDLAILNGAEYYRVWGNSFEALQEDTPPFEYNFGISFFDYLELNRLVRQRFYKSMAFRLQKEAQAIVSAYDFSPYNFVVDVGGGNGVLLSTILENNPHLNGIGMDIASLAEEFLAVTKFHNVSERCGFIEGDFFKEVTPGGDLYMLSYVIHDWGDEQAVEILKKCRQAFVSDGKLLLLEQLLPGEISGANPAINLDLFMLMLNRGRVRSEQEHKFLLAQAGFKLTNVISTASPRSIIEAIPV